MDLPPTLHGALKDPCYECAQESTLGFFWGRHGVADLLDGFWEGRCHPDDAIDHAVRVDFPLPSGFFPMVPVDFPKQIRY